MNASIDLGSRRFLQPGRWLWLRVLLWGLALLVLVIVPSSLVAGVVYAAGALATGTPLDRLMDAPGPVHLLAMVVMAAAALATYSGLVIWGEQRDPTELALGPAPRELIAGLAIGGAMMALVVLVSQAAGWMLISRSSVTDAWRAAAMAVESGVIEEVALRLIVFRLLWRAFGPWAALGLSALLFGVLHITNPNSSWFAALCIAAEAGVMLAGFYMLTGRLWVSIGVHAGWNFTQGWIFGAAVSGTDFFEGGPFMLEPATGVSEILSGGAFGPEASLAGLAVGTLVGAATLWLAWKRGRFAIGTGSAVPDGAANP